MPILDKLNKKLEEAGVEEHGRTIEEAVDLLPAMGGSGGFSFKKITQDSPVHPTGAGGGVITYCQIGERDKDNCSLAMIFFNLSGSPYTYTSSNVVNNKKICKWLSTSVDLNGGVYLDTNFILNKNGDIKVHKSVELSTINFTALVPVQWLVDEEGNPLE